MDEGQRRFNGDSIGRVMPVLFERAGRRAGQLVGRSTLFAARALLEADEALDRANRGSRDGSCELQQPFRCHPRIVNADDNDRGTRIAKRVDVDSWRCP